MHWWLLSVCLYVRLSVCPVHDPKSRTAGHRKLKIDRNEAHDAGDPWSRLEVKRSMVEVTRPLHRDWKSAISSEPEGLWTSNLIYGWSTVTHITDTRDDLKGEGHQAAVGGCLSRHTLAGCGGGVTAAAALQAAQLVVFLAYQSLWDYMWNLYVLNIFTCLTTNTCQQLALFRWSVSVFYRLCYISQAERGLAVWILQHLCTPNYG